MSDEDKESAAALFAGGTDLVSSALSYRSAGKNRKWMAKMDNTKYQRRVKDLRAAGLNPMLAVSGSGIAGGSPGTPPMPTFDLAANRQASTARKLMNSQINKNNAEANYTNTKADIAEPFQNIMNEISSAMDAINKLLGGKGWGEDAVNNTASFLKNFKNRPSPTQAKKQKLSEEHFKYELKGVPAHKRKTFDFKKGK